MDRHPLAFTASRLHRACLFRHLRELEAEIPQVLGEVLSDWALEGWAGGQWFADAAASCGAALTRSRLAGPHLSLRERAGVKVTLVTRQFIATVGE